MNRRTGAIIALAFIALAIIVAGAGYIIGRNSAPADPYGPVPISSNTGFQTGDNDAPTANPRSHNAP